MIRWNDEKDDDTVNALREFVQKVVKWRKLLATAIFVIAISLCAHILMGNNGWITYRQKKVEYQKLQQDLQSMDDENRRLDSKIKGLKSDPKAIEKEAREQLRYVKPGEVIYLLPEAPAQHSAQLSPQAGSTQR